MTKGEPADSKGKDTISLPMDLAKQLTAAAEQTGQTQAGLVRQVLQQYFSRDKRGNSVYLSTPVNALVQGFYKQKTPLSEIKLHGDFGLGTFNNLDGEMVLLDGIVYQAKADGCAAPVEDKVETPFACVTFFSADTVEKLDGRRLRLELKELLDRLIPSLNMLYAIRIEGKFEYVKTRSVPPQENYRPLVEVSREQPTFEFSSVKGTLGGFYTPQFMASLNVPGYHLHFLNQDRFYSFYPAHPAIFRNEVGIRFNIKGHTAHIGLMHRADDFQGQGITKFTGKGEEFFF
jgi:acetolactate decarboxylase